MITSEAEAKERYKQIEREADDWNRIIGVRRLRPSEVSKLIAEGVLEDSEGERN